MWGWSEAEQRWRISRHRKSCGLEAARPETFWSKENERRAPREWGPGAGDKGKP